MFGCFCASAWPGHCLVQVTRKHSHMCNPDPAPAPHPPPPRPSLAMKLTQPTQVMLTSAKESKAQTEGKEIADKVGRLG